MKVATVAEVESGATNVPSCNTWPSQTTGISAGFAVTPAAITVGSAVALIAPEEPGALVIEKPSTPSGLRQRIQNRIVCVISLPILAFDLSHAAAIENQDGAVQVRIERRAGRPGGPGPRLARRSRR